MEQAVNFHSWVSVWRHVGRKRRPVLYVNQNRCDVLQGNHERQNRWPPMKTEKTLKIWDLKLGAGMTSALQWGIQTVKIVATSGCENFTVPVKCVL